MKKNIDIVSILKAVANGFIRYNLTIFIVVLVTGLSTAVLMLNETLRKASDTSGYTSSLDSATFDQGTIDRVKQLHTSAEAVNTTLPTTRINPFNE